MLKKIRFSLAIPEGVSERLMTLCDVRGKGFPLSGSGATTGYKPVGDAAYIGGLLDYVAAKKSLGKEISKADFRKAMKQHATDDARNQIGRYGAYGRPGRPPRQKYSGSPLSPAQTRKSLGQMQWTYLGQFLTGELDDLVNWIPSIDPVPAGYGTFPGEIARYDDVCGTTNARWNGRSYGAVDQAAFFFNQCAANQAQNGQNFDLFADPDNPKPLEIYGTNNCISWGPRAAFADWQLTFRHGRMIDRSHPDVPDSGTVRANWEPEKAGRPGGMPAAPPRLQLESGFIPWSKVKDHVANDPFSDRGYAEASGRSDSATGAGGKPPLPAPPPAYTKQKKYVPAGEGFAETYRAMRNLFRKATEIQDFWEILYESLDKEVQIRTDCNGGVLCMVEAVMMNLDKLDVVKAGEDLILNEIEDQAVGRSHGAIKGKTPAPGLGTGVGNAGPRIYTNP